MDTTHSRIRIKRVSDYPEGSTGAQKSEVEHAEWLRVTCPLPSILRIEAQPTCFRSDQGAEAELQRRLRSLLFLRTANIDKNN
jgi:hypothetical protein